MIYFVPAWYEENEWKESEQTWYLPHARSEMDDTVKQIQLFHRNKAYPYRILLLGFTPNLRHFLHRQSCFRAPYWSCFDAIQEVRRKKTAVLSFHELNWPEGTEFIYTPFVIEVMLHGKRYAQIQFGEDGNPIRVDMYMNGQLSRENVYDDRGFLSCTIVFENGKMAYEQYLTEQGTWKICRFADGHVVVNPKSDTYLIGEGKNKKTIPFKNRTYASMEDVIAEVLQSFLEQTKKKDMFCVAMHSRHTHLLQQQLKTRKLILSFFGDRLKNIHEPLTGEFMRDANYIVVDSRRKGRMVHQETGRTDGIMFIPPYDARVDHGISQRLHVQNILVAVDNLPDAMFEKIVLQTAAYMQNNKDAKVVFFTRQVNYDREQRILEKTQNILQNHGLEPEWAAIRSNQGAENELEEEIPVLYSVRKCVDEMAASRCIREQRLIVDLSEKQDLFLQISAVSMGIPQILIRETQYLVNGKNGRVNKNGDFLTADFAFYLETLGNWNEAMIQAYRLGERYNTANILKQWREVIDKVEQS